MREDQVLRDRAQLLNALDRLEEGLRSLITPLGRAGSRAGEGPEPLGSSQL